MCIKGIDYNFDGIVVYLFFFVYYIFSKWEFFWVGMIDNRVVFWRWMCYFDCGELVKGFIKGYMI